MSLAEHLHKGRTALLSQWVQGAESVYAFDTAGFLRSKQDSVANPVGLRTREAAEALFAAMLEPEPDMEALTPPLAEFLRVRAIQDLPPEKTLAAFFSFKHLIRAYLAQESVFVDFALREELTHLEARIDELALLAFSIYSRCREELFHLRLQDMRRRSDVFVRLAQKRDPALQDTGHDALPDA